MFPAEEVGGEKVREVAELRSEIRGQRGEITSHMTPATERYSVAHGPRYSHHQPQRGMRPG